MPETETLYNVSFTLVRHRDDDCETKWTVDESHQQTPRIEGFDDMDVITDARDGFGRRMIAVTGVPQARLDEILDAGRDLGGFLDLRGKELFDEMVRRLRETLGMQTEEDGDD